MIFDPTERTTAALERAVAWNMQSLVELIHAHLFADLLPA